ncbi:MAG TPA: TniQ family protein [Arenimonas sp.]|uniref:TniQ family protein n=1 Tax=Arenimonas sp. TaxID=1872635 RepID=UPI002D7F437E|nr:TniQ family protein [Arenimonas sp.]HEU0153152.1 TniQ family protein [Arenimonas sp.]
MNARPQGWLRVPPPQAGELISSWLHRLALANHKTDQTLITTMFGTGAQIWTRDTDRSFPVALEGTLSKWTGVPEARIEAMTLRPMVGRVVEDLIRPGVCGWILPAGVYHRVRRSPGLQFCPACLAEPPTYARIAWRQSFVTTCLRHHQELLDRCPSCGSVFMFHRMHPDRLGRWPCIGCGRDLRSDRPTAKPLSNTVRLQRRMELAAATGGARIDQRWHISLALFQGVKFLTRVLISAKCQGLLRRKVALGCDAAGVATSARMFEHLPIDHRRLLLHAASCWLVDWPEQFLADVAGEKIMRSHLIAAGGPAPFWMQRALDRLPTAQPHVVTADETQAAANWVRGSGREVTRKAIVETLGLTSWEAIMWRNRRALSNTGLGT